MSNALKHDKNLTSLPVKEFEDIIFRNAKDECFLVKGTDCINEDGFRRFYSYEKEKMKDVNTGVYDLESHSSGIQIRFKTDSDKIIIKGENQAIFYMENSTPIACMGMSLYVYDERLKMYVLHDVLRFPLDEKTYNKNLCHFKDKRIRKYILYLPLYMGVTKLEIGLRKDSIIEHNPFSSDKRILIYGTSITQGCSASHPGMSYPNIISRELDMEVINFGFSGSALLEKEMAEIIRDRKMNLLILDTEPNSNSEMRLKKNLKVFMDTFYEKCKNIPVIISSRMLFAMDNYDDELVKNGIILKRYQKKLVKEYKSLGYDIHFIDGSKMIKGNYSEYTADGIHPDDYGMILLAKGFLKKLKELNL